MKPWPRAGHTAVAFGSLMVVFGGMNGKQNFNDLSVYSIRTLAPLVADLARHCAAQLLRHDTTRHLHDRTHHGTDSRNKPMDGGEH